MCWALHTGLCPLNGHRKVQGFQMPQRSQDTSLNGFPEALTCGIRGVQNEKVWCQFRPYLSPARRPSLSPPGLGLSVPHL